MWLRLDRGGEGRGRGSLEMWARLVSMGIEVSMSSLVNAVILVVAVDLVSLVGFV